MTDTDTPELQTYSNRDGFGVVVGGEQKQLLAFADDADRRVRTELAANRGLQLFAAVTVFLWRLGFHADVYESESLEGDEVARAAGTTLARLLAEIKGCPFRPADLT